MRFRGIYIYAPVSESLKGIPDVEASIVHACFMVRMLLKESVIPTMSVTKVPKKMFK